MLSNSDSHYTRNITHVMLSNKDKGSDVGKAF